MDANTIFLVLVLVILVLFIFMLSNNTIFKAIHNGSYGVHG